MWSLGVSAGMFCSSHCILLCSVQQLPYTEQLTAEEQSSLDAELLNAAVDNSLVRIAQALDAGADINAVDAQGSYRPPYRLQQAHP